MSKESPATADNTVFVTHFVRSNPPTADFTNTEVDNQNAASLERLRRSHFGYRDADERKASALR
jgi:hypothetical protein